MFGRKRRHADAISPVSIAMAQGSQLVNFAAQASAEPAAKSPIERHADTLASAIQNLRDRIANEIFDRDMYRDLVSDCEKRVEEYERIIAALQPAHDKLMDTPRIPLGIPLADAPDEIQAQLA